MRYLKLRESVLETGLHPNTLRKYADQGTIPSKRTPSGQRLFDVDGWLNGQQEIKEVAYARVSSAKQRDDLERQAEYLRIACPQAEIIKDIGSGLNFKRKGLRSILGRLLRGEKLRLVVAHRDRLCRFGFDLIEHLVVSNGGELVVLHKSVHASPTEELTQDLLAILGVFSARMHGLRKYSETIAEDPHLSDDNPG